MKKEVDKLGTIRYVNIQGQLHRDDGGPAVEWANGDKWWLINGKTHRLDGPAVEEADGTNHWRINGQFHRIDGPAREWADGRKEYWINGKKITEEEFLKHPEVLLYWIVNLPGE